jgi:hypothetical protein
MTACERDLDEKDDGNLLHQIKRTPTLNEHRLFAALPLRILLARDAIDSGYITRYSRGRRRIMLKKMKSNRLWKPSMQFWRRCDRTLSL